MSDLVEENKRVSLQVTSLSTQLIDSIEKQSKLEEELNHAKRELEQLRIQSKKYTDLEARYKDLYAKHDLILSHNLGLGRRLEKESKEKEEAVEEVSKLQKEVEDLTASLFDEANKMVSDARKEAFATTKRNEALISQLQERDLLIENLQNQLKELKDAFHERDSDSISTRNSFDVSRKSSQAFNPINSTTLEQPILYSPTINAIRFDLKLFIEFKKFLKTIDVVDSIRSSDTKFLKKLLTDDIDPALRLDLAHSINWLAKRSLMSAIIDGRVAIEPVSGINETYRLNFQNDQKAESDVKSHLYSYPQHSPPVAIDQPCSICGEDRNDILEHSRLYVMKIHSKPGESSMLAPVSSPNPAHQYPLCSYCLFRVRSTCELFAFLRSLKTDAWNVDDEESIKKAWVELSRLRSKIFWSKVGIWDIDSNIVTTRITPGSNDHVSKIISKQSDSVRGGGGGTSSSLESPSSDSSVDNSLDSLPGSLPNNTSHGDLKYKASPLSKQIHSPDHSEAKIITTDEFEEKNGVTILSEQDDTIDVDAENDIKQKHLDDDEEGGYASDILDNYSLDEDVEEDEVDDVNGTIKEVKVNNGLHIITDASQGEDDSLGFEEPTPIIQNHDSFEKDDSLKNGVNDDEQVNTPSKVLTESTNRSKDELTSGDEDQFVDA